MGTATGTYASFDDRFQTLGENLKHVVEYIAAARGPASEVKAAPAPETVFAKARKAIKDHPVAAVGIAFAFGYGVMRLIRR